MVGAADDPGSTGATLAEIGAVTAVPALAMAIGSAAIATGGEPTERLQARLQHFSGGLLIGAVITDIFPILRSRLVVGVGRGEAAPLVDWHNILAGVTGFCAALLLMYSVKSLGLDELGAEGPGPAAISEVGSGCDKDREEPPVAERPGWLAQLRLRLSRVQPLAVVAPSEAASRAASKEPLLQAAAGARTPAGQRKPTWQEPRKGLELAVARLTARAAALGQLAKADEVDREAVDEEVHGLDFLIDVARRRCQNDIGEPLDAGCTARLRMHVADLAEDVCGARELDLGDLPAIDAQLRMIAGTLRRIHLQAEQRGAAFRRWGPRPQSASAPSEDAASCAPGSATNGGAASAAARGGELSQPAPPMPWGLVLAVLIDSAVDGMLIGLAGSVALNSGWLMAMATAIEMGFLGYSFACAAAGPAARRGGRALQLAVLSLPPATMLASSLLASRGAQDVEGRPSFVGLIAFSLAAVLFLVVEELLLEAHEKEGNDVWHISVWLYVGLLLSIGLDVAA